MMPGPATYLLQVEALDLGADLKAVGLELVEGELSRHSVDAYHRAFENYHFCAVCDFENSFLTLLTVKLWASAVVRRLRPALQKFSVEVARPQ
jgi:hypothetical protein